MADPVPDGAKVEQDAPKEKPGDSKEKTVDLKEQTASAEIRAKTVDTWVKATGSFLSVVVAVAGAWWTFHQYNDQQAKIQADRRIEAEKLEAARRFEETKIANDRAEEARKTSAIRAIEIRKPFLEKQLNTHFGMMQEIGKLVALNPKDTAWKEAETKYWAGYWTDLAMVESDEIRDASKGFSKALRTYSKEPNDENKTALENQATAIATAVRQAVDKDWKPPSLWQIIMGSSTR